MNHPDPKNPVIQLFYRYAHINPALAPQPKEKETKWKELGADLHGKSIDPPKGRAEHMALNWWL